MSVEPALERVGTVRVIYGDTDQMGVVYYANYLRYFEVARAEWLRGHGHEYRRFEADGVLLPVTEAQVRYRSPARYDDRVVLHAAPTVARIASVRFEYRLERESDGAVLVTGHTVHACVDRAGRPRRMPPELAGLLRDRRAPSEGA
jgi:acyl-CoA thioester hydrolase